jgi:hypothetical protein
MSEEKIDKRSKEYRQRSVADVSVDEAHREGLVMCDTRDPNTKAKQDRERVPVNSGQVLSLRGYTLDPDFRHYWVYEDPTRPTMVEAYKSAFYEHCVSPWDNQIITAASGAGKQYLMRLPMKYYLEDMAAAKKKRDDLRRRDNKLNPGEYTVDKFGKPVEDGEVIVRRSASNNPYA